jgi:periplasmic copper chaperone A
MLHTAKTRRIVSARGLFRAAVAGCATGAAVLMLAVPALAHITVTPDSAPAGSAAVLTFHVPDEEATADTVKVDMEIPTVHPIADLLVEPVPGWTVSVKTITLAKPVVTDDGRFTQAVSEVIWSGGKIAPGQFQDFSVSADPLPTGVSTLAFKALQIYSNGDVVRWIDLAAPGQPKPDHPAPVLTLTSGTTSAAHSAGTTAASAGTTAASDGAASSGANSDGTALVLAIAALAAGLLALAAAGAGLWRRRVSGG